MTFHSVALAKQAFLFDLTASAYASLVVYAASTQFLLSDRNILMFVIMKNSEDSLLSKRKDTILLYFWISRVYLGV